MKLFLFLLYSWESFSMSKKHVSVRGKMFFYLPYTSNLIATESIYSLCSYQHKKPIKYVSLVMSILPFFFFFNEMTRTAANEAQLGKSVESASSVHVLSVKNWVTPSSSQAFDFQGECRDGSCMCFCTLNLWKFCYFAILGGFICLSTLKTARIIW